MSDYFLSDVHLRDDRPARARRLLGFLDRLTPADRLVIAGDLCDFWMGSRTRPDDLARSAGLRGLVSFREAGGRLEILAGNHDLWLCPFYRDRLGATILTEPVRIESHGLRIHLVHGHLLGARKKWKAFLESEVFFRGFGAMPGPAARAMDAMLDAKNQRGLLDDETRHLAVYRQYARDLADEADLVVLGHVHRAVDEPGRPRMIVLGGWQHRMSYLKVDESGAAFLIEGGDPDDVEADSKTHHRPTTSPARS